MIVDGETVASFAAPGPTMDVSGQVVDEASSLKPTGL